jgi:D-serine deaminase-like pyridoxal phosphate-dependent protein
VNVAELETPCLLVERSALEANLARMAAFFAGRAARLRPHFKSHKCSRIALRQLAAGNAVGITCAKLSEAEVLARAGVRDVLIANQLAGEGKLRRLAELNRSADVKCCVDAAWQVEALGTAARAAGVELGVLVELDVGMGRCGVADGEAALELAGAVGRSAGLRFLGIQAYEGHAVLVEDAAERRRLAERAMAEVLAARRRIERAGLAVGVVSSGGTGTYDLAGAAEGVDEIQAGSYALMDARYRRVRPEFANALFILATVISRSGGRAVLDVGVKGCGAEFGPPEVAGVPAGAATCRLSEEHCTVTGELGALAPGARVRLVPSHGCTTCNLHRQLHLVEGDRVLETWPIDGSGCMT